MLRDIRHALKLLWNEKAFTLTVLITLAVCVGANTAIFSVIRTVLLAPLPYPEADRLVTVYNSYPGAGVPRASNGSFDYFMRRERIESFDALAQYQGWGHTVGEAGETERVTTMRVTPSFFPLLGATPIAGRGFREEEMLPGSDQVVVLTWGYWQDRLGGEDVVGRDLRVDGRPFRVVGVLPESFRMPVRDQPRFFVPIPYDEDDRLIDSWHNNSASMIGRLAPGAGVERARAENDAVNAALIAEWPVPNARQLLEDAGYHTQVHPLHEDLVRDIRPTLYLLWGGVLFVLLIGCVNIANIILARSQVRLRDTATRLALGASRRRLAREMLTHALVLAGLGGAAGVGVGWAGIRLLAALGADQLPRGAEIGLDGVVLLFSLGVAALAGLLFGAIPAAQLLRDDLRTVLQTESRGGTADRRTLWVRNALVTAQVALAFLLLIGAGLLLMSFRSAIAVDPGFRADGVLTASLALPEARYPEDEDRERFVDALLEELAALPGLEHAAVTTQLPFTGNNSSSVILPEGYQPPPGESLLSPYQTWVAGSYFDAMGIPLVEGRLFEGDDGRGDRRVIILDQWLARRYFGDESPLGRRMLWGGVPEMADEDDYYTVVGVVGTVKQQDLTAGPEEHVGAYYFPYRQNRQLFLTLVASTTGDPEALTGPIRDRLRQRDAELPLFGITTMRGRIDESLTSRRASMTLLLTFAGVALFLAILGIYGVLAYAVAQRTREMGIRIALGSSAREIFMLVLSHGARVTGIGLLVGGVGAVVLGGVIRSLLYGVEPLDPIVLASVAATLATVALAACAVPAWQATRVDPVQALVGE